jgi:signal peptidase I
MKMRIPIWLKVLFTAILIVLLVKTFAFTSCSIPFTGMENTLYQGEKVLVNKWSYGLRIPFTSSHFLSKRVNRGDVVLFNNPVSHEKERPVFAREWFISRCVGGPGDTLMLNDEWMVTSQRVFSPDSKQLYAYPYEAEDALLEALRRLNIENNLLVGYSEGRYVRSFSHYEHYLLKQKLGASFDIYPVHTNDTTNSHPWVIPGKGKTVQVYPWNVTLLCNTILYHENRQAAVKNDTLWVDGKPVTSYTFQKDYYWMASNNPINMADSRLFGLVPHECLVGKAVYIWYSSRKERIFQPVQ